MGRLFDLGYGIQDILLLPHIKGSYYHGVVYDYLYNNPYHKKELVKNFIDKCWTEVLVKIFMRKCSKELIQKTCTPERKINWDEDFMEDCKNDFYEGVCNYYIEETTKINNIAIKKYIVFVNNTIESCEIINTK